MKTQIWLTDWLMLRSYDLQPRTKESYQDLIDRYVNPAIGEKEIADLSPDDIRHLLARIVGAGHKRTAELVYVMLKCAFSELDHNPMLKVKRPKHHQKSPVPWSDEEIVTYMTALVDHPHGVPLSLALLLGLRRGEICGLKWGDFDFRLNVVRIHNQRIRLATGQIIDSQPKSATSNRTILLPEPVANFYKSHRGLPDAYVTALTPSGLDAAHRRLVMVLDMRHIPLHGLRHSMASSCIRHGGEMKALQEILGHSNYSVTANIYTHSDDKLKKNTLDAGAQPCYTVLQAK